MSTMECVINVSEGGDGAMLERLRRAAGDHLLDVHVDPHHNRSVLTLSGPDVQGAARAVATTAIDLLDLRAHVGVHPRIGVVDVVPFVPLPGFGSTMEDALAERARFSEWIAATHDVPCFWYGPERSLPYVRKHAFASLVPDVGPTTPHPTAGAVAAGARPVLVAYNLWLPTSDVALARAIARDVRRPGIRALGLDVGGRAQVSCNLIEPDLVGPMDAYDLVSAHIEPAGAELVGLVPDRVLRTIPASRWSQLDLDEERTIEARLEQHGLRSGRS